MVKYEEDFQAWKKWLGGCLGGGGGEEGGYGVFV